jgi:hypothetical protein
MFRSAVCLVFILFATTTASAQWKVENGKKISKFPPLTGEIATLSANAPAKGFSARLHIECFTHHELTGLSLGILLSKNPPDGPMGWTYRFDDQSAVRRRPTSRMLPANYIHLGDASSVELQGLRTAAKLRLTLQPATGGTLPFDFDLRGAAAAIQKIGCKEFRK